MLTNNNPMIYFYENTINTTNNIKYIDCLVYMKYIFKIKSYI